MDNKNKFWLLSTTKSTLIEGLRGKSTKGSFVLIGDQIFSINNKNQIWSYNLTQDKYRIIRNVDQAVMNISDVRDKILITQAISSKKDVVEFSSSK